MASLRSRSFSDDFRDDWDEFIGRQHLRHLLCRMDHAGVIESEDALLLRMCAQEVLLALLRNLQEVEHRIGQSAPDGFAAGEILSGITAGLFRMIGLSHGRRHVFWTSGGPMDRERLVEFMLAFRSGACDDNQPEPPHVLQRKSELVQRSQFQLKELRSLAQSGSLAKGFRKEILQLPGVAAR